MKSFFTSFIASLTALLTWSILSTLFVITFLVGFAASFSSVRSLSREPAVLTLTLSDAITDTPESTPWGGFDPLKMEFNPSYSLLSVLESIERAATDDLIGGIYLRIDPQTPISLSTLGEIREALVAFKSSGKPIYAYSESYSQRSYLLGSVADRVMLNPAGDLQWSGLSSPLFFYKGLFDKLGVEAEVIRHGSYKAAVEPFIATQMSPENREQTELLFSTIWQAILSELSAQRPITPAQLDHCASYLEVNSPERALSLQMVDTLCYEGAVDSLWAACLNADKPNYLSLADYQQGEAIYTTNSTSKNHIEVIYAEGEIEGVEGSSTVIRTQRLVAQLRDARESDAVKAVVLRINSPGGSALASEVICEQVQKLQQQKPVIVSMGEVAASGGYYIAAPADVILTTPATVTGSIGAFSLLFNAQQGLQSKLGITTDVVNTNPSADMGMPYRPLTTAERAYLQGSVDRIYATFVERVATGRNLSYEEVDRLAEGRIWSGVSAVELGLADDFGGLHRAISLAIERAGVEGDYRLTTPTPESDPITELFSLLGVSLNSLSQPTFSLADVFSQRANGLGSPAAATSLFGGSSASLAGAPLPTLLEHYNAVRSLQGDGTIQTKMPYRFNIR